MSRVARGVAQLMLVWHLLAGGLERGCFHMLMPCINCYQDHGLWLPVRALRLDQ